MTTNKLVPMFLVLALGGCSADLAPPGESPEPSAGPAEAAAEETVSSTTEALTLLPCASMEKTWNSYPEPEDLVLCSPTKLGGTFCYHTPVIVNATVTCANSCFNPSSFICIA